LEIGEAKRGPEDRFGHENGGHVTRLQFEWTLRVKASKFGKDRVPTRTSQFNPLKAKSERTYSPIVPDIRESTVVF
jgi:hypothetical protein